MSKKKDAAYDAALALIQQILDDDLRSVAVEVIIRAHVRRVKGFDDPAGELAMKLRREAAPL